MHLPNRLLTGLVWGKLGNLPGPHPLPLLPAMAECPRQNAGDAGSGLTVSLPEGNSLRMEPEGV